jgi:hypothetical protein
MMTSPADSLSLILRRLDVIERKLDRILEEELRTPTAIGYSVRRGRPDAHGDRPRRRRRCHRHLVLQCRSFTQRKRPSLRAFSSKSVP